MTELSDDILREIFDYFALDIYDRGAVCHNYSLKYDTDGQEDLKTVQNLRLVCRNFHQLASPLLVPVLRMYLSAASNHRVDQLTRNPFIAAGVRLVQLSVEYRPKELAHDFSHYTNLHIKALKETASACDYYTEFMGQISDDELNGDEDEVLKAMRTYWAITAAWRDQLDQGEDGYRYKSWDEESDRYKDLLSNSFNEYQRLQYEQEALITSGTFTSSLATSLARTPSLRAFAFLDEVNLELDDFLSRDKLTVLANDFTKLHKVMINPHTWNLLEDLDPIPDLPVVQLLWQLPLALHEKGKPLEDLYIERLPIQSNFDKLCPSSTSALKRAFSSLRRVRISTGNCSVIRHVHMPPEPQSHLTNFLSCVFSSLSVQSIDLDLLGLQLNDGRGSFSGKETPGSFNPIGAAFGEVQRENMKEVLLSHLTFTEAELQRFFESLGNRLERIHVYHIGVSEGGWAKPLGILREKVTASPRGCTVYFSTLCGGGFDKVVYAPKGEELESQDDSSPGSWQRCLSETPEEDRAILKAAEMYVLGEEEVNPLVQFEV